MKRRVVDFIKLKNYTDSSINSSALIGLRRYNNVLKYSLYLMGIIGGASFLVLAKLAEIDYNLNDVKKKFLKKIENDPRIESIFLNGNKKLIIEYIDNDQFNSKEDQTMITDARFKLINNWAKGVVLETCCGSFRNAKFYDKNKIKMIVACDWINEFLELALAYNSMESVRFVKMDCSNLEYVDNSFDTIVDTFGLQASYDYVQQYNEMKRVCKVGGKIILLEIGESKWKNTNSKIISKAEEELRERGQVLFRNYDELILKDPQVKVIYHKRKLKGRLFMYVLEKI